MLLASGPAVVKDYVEADDPGRPGDVDVIVENTRGDYEVLTWDAFILSLGARFTYEDDAPALVDDEVWADVDPVQRELLEHRARDLRRMITGDEHGDLRTKEPRGPEFVDRRYDRKSVPEHLRVERMSREISKRREAQPLRFSPDSLRKQARALRDGGTVALVHGNTGRKRPVLANVPADLQDAVKEYVASQVNEPTIDRENHIHGLTRFLRSRDITTDRTDENLLSILDACSQGSRLYADAPTRRSVAARPQRQLGRWSTMTPYEHVQIDATPLDLYCLDQYGKLQAVTYLLVAVCVALRKVVAMRLVQGMHPFDSRAVRGLIWDAVRGSVAPDDFTRVRATQVPDRLTIVNRLGRVHMDRGPQFNSVKTIGTLGSLGFNATIDDPGSGVQKPHVESGFRSFTEQILQPWPGYKGANVRQRGLAPEKGPLLTEPIVLRLLWWYVDAVRHNTPHGSLRHPDFPTQHLTPNEAAILFMRTQGRLGVDANLSDALKLLDSRTVAFGHHGLRVNNIDYDGPALKELHEERIHYGERGRQGTRLTVFFEDREPHRIAARLPDGRVEWVARKGQDAPQVVLQDQLHRDLMSFIVDRAAGQAPRYTPKELKETTKQIVQAAHDFAQAAADRRVPAIAKPDMREAGASDAGTPARPALTSRFDDALQSVGWT